MNTITHYIVHNARLEYLPESLWSWAILNSA